MMVAVYIMIFTKSKTNLFQHRMSVKRQFEPLCETLNGPYSKQIDSLHLLQFHEHYPLSLLFPPSPIIHAPYSHRRSACSSTQLFDSSQQGIVATIDAETLEERSPGRPPRAYTTMPGIS